MSRTQPSTLGAFSVSLAVKDLSASRAFYEKLGFSVAGGDPSMNFQIMRNGEVTIGLFQGMFEQNILTFNPGWTSQAEDVAGEFEDVRALQAELRSQGVAIHTPVEEGKMGPGSFVVLDPDGNPVLVDQHR